MALKGIDISQWQGNIDLAAIKPQVNFVIIRLGYSTKKDPNAERNIQLCESLGIPYGCYWYCYAANQNGALAEAQAMVAAIGNHKPTYPMYYDIEDNSLPQGYILTQIAKSFCNYLESKGFYTGIYASLSWLNTRLTGLDAYDKWVAEWGASCHYKGVYGMWQYTSNGYLNGYNGRLDMNLAYKDYPSIIKAAGLNGWKASAPAEPSQPSTPVHDSSKSITDLAWEVIEGYWGNGTDRKKNLEAAGYDYNVIQSKVDEIMRYQKITSVAKEVIAGKWGNGNTRIWKLKRAGYNPTEIQNAVNQVLDGTR